MGFLEKGLIIYTALALACLYCYPQFIFNAENPTDASVLAWFNVAVDSSGHPVYNGNSGSNGYNLAGNAANSTYNGILKPGEIPTGSSILGFMDPVWQVFGWISTFFKMLFSPVVIIYNWTLMGAPSELLFFLGIPLAAAFVVGLVIFMRAGFG